MTNSDFKRVIDEVAAHFGIPPSESLASGVSKLLIGRKFVSFAYQEAVTPDHVRVYVDLVEGDRNDTKALLALMHLNFALAGRGTLSLHPVSDHIIYTFRHPIGEKVTGKELAEALLESIGVVSDAVGIEI